MLRRLSHTVVPRRALASGANAPALAVVPVHSNHVADDVRALHEQRFESFKARYEQPLAAALVEARAPAIAAAAHAAALEQRVHRRERTLRRQLGSREAQAARARAAYVEAELARRLDIDDSALLGELEALGGSAPEKPYTWFVPARDAVGRDDHTPPAAEVLPHAALRSDVSADADAAGNAEAVRAAHAADAAREAVAAGQRAPGGADAALAVALRKFGLLASDDAEQASALAADEAAAVESLDNSAAVFERRVLHTDRIMADSKFERADVVHRERRVALTLDVDALQLPLLAERRLVELAAARYDPSSHSVRLTCDEFGNYAQNKRAVQRTAQQLLEEAYRADSNYLPLPPSADGAAHEAAAADAGERQLLEGMAQELGADIGQLDPLTLGPALAPSAFVRRVADDMVADAAAAQAGPAAPANALRVFRFGRVPERAARTAAAADTRALVAALVDEADRSPDVAGAAAPQPLDS